MSECQCQPYAAELEAELSALREQFDAFKERVRNTAARYAVEHDWCTVVDEALGELGLARVVRDFSTTVSVQMSFTLSREATSADLAADSVYKEDIIEHIYNLDSSELRHAIDDYTLGEWEASEA